MPLARIIVAKKAMLIIMLVDAPKPLSILLEGITSSSIFGVEQSKTPALIPNMHLPKHIVQKLRYIAVIEPIKPTKLNLIIVFLLPNLMKSPPNIDPIAIPTIVLVVNIVAFNAIT